LLLSQIFSVQLLTTVDDCFCHMFKLQKYNMTLLLLDPPTSLLLLLLLIFYNRPIFPMFLLVRPGTPNVHFGEFPKVNLGELLIQAFYLCDALPVTH